MFYEYLHRRRGNLKIHIIINLLLVDIVFYVFRCFAVARITTVRYGGTKRVAAEHNGIADKI